MGTKRSSRVFKVWSVVLFSTVMFGTLEQAVNPVLPQLINVVHADVSTGAIKVNATNMSDYFTNIGSATEPSNGDVTLTPNDNNKAGSAVLTRQISLV